MASPVGHLLLALSCTGLRERSSDPRPALFWTVIVTACWAPDLDFIPGMLVGEPNRYHGGASHSLTGALLFSSAVVLGFWRSTSNSIRLGSMAFLAYASHLLGDWLTVDNGTPIGIPVFWPFSDIHFISPVTIFRNIQHGTDGAGPVAFLVEVFSTANVLAIGLELVITLPILVAVESGRRHIRLNHRRSR